MTEQTMRAWAEIHLGALRENLALARRLTGKKIMCVIKGDAHGHGAVACGRALAQAGADAFAVACLEEAVTLREAGITQPILVLGWTPAEYTPRLAQYNLIQSVLDEDYARELSGAGVPLEVHGKLDTGMSRTGICAQADPGEAARVIARIGSLPNLRLTGLFTHFAAADMPEKDAFTGWQRDNFLAVLRELKALGFDRQLLCHAGNSAAILWHPDCHFDMVRMGVMMYGLRPDGKTSGPEPLRPVLTLKARVIQVKELPVGALIGYGCTARVTRPTRLAVVGAGYADAYPRSLSNRGAWAVIRGARCPQIGRICMDLCMFDITDAPAEISRGDEVILCGRGGMSLDELASLAGTINCEPTSLLTNRVKKVYLEEG